MIKNKKPINKEYGYEEVVNSGIDDDNISL